MNAVSLVHKKIAEIVRSGDVCIDATAGRGFDTAFLCELVGPSGKVIAFDIQQSAITSTRALLDSKGFDAELHNLSHEFIGDFAKPKSVKCVVFNLGFLPNGDHSIFTHFESTSRAIEKALDLISDDGLICVSIYHGGATGYDERDRLLEWLKNLDSQKYQVLVVTFHNWFNDPPIPVFIFKNEQV